MPDLDCICTIQYTKCGAIHQNLILIFRESKPTIENRVAMDGSTFFVMVKPLRAENKKKKIGSYYMLRMWETI